MELKGLFTDTFNRLEKTLDLRSRRHDLIASNIANKDTPGYKAFDLIVKEEIQNSDAGQNLELARTHPMHIKAKMVKQDDFHLKRLEKTPFASGDDGNSVDLDKEMGKLSENNLMYNVTAHILSKRIIGLKTAIQGGKK